MTYKFDEIINGLEKFMEKEYLNSEDGNSFFFTWWSINIKGYKMKDNVKQDSNEKVKQNNKYMHYKNKKEYELVDKDIKIQVNNEWVNAILYKDKNGKKYVRSQMEFFEKFHSI